MKKNSKMLYAILCITILVVMIYYSNVQSFWHDELYQLGLSGRGNSFGHMMKNYAQLWDYTPPLYSVLMWIWVRLVPLSARFLLLPSELFVTIGVFVLALCGEKLAGKKTGIFAAILSATSSTLILGAGHEFRAYSLFFLTSAIFLYVFILRYQEGENKKKSIAFILAMIALAYTHYYGILIILALFLAELFCAQKRERKLRVLFTYVIGGLSFMPWGILVLINHKTSVTKFWTDRPNWRTILDVIHYLTNQEPITYICFLCAATVAIYYIVNRKISDDKSKSIVKVCLWVVAFDMMVMFSYAFFINPTGGAFHERYFLGLVPYIVLLLSFFIKRVYEEFLMNIAPFGVIAVIMFVYLATTNFYSMVEEANKRREPYEQSVETLKDKGDIKKDTTAIVITDCDFVMKGYQYFFKQGKKVQVDMFSQESKVFDTLVTKYDKIYVLAGHNKLTKENEKIMEKSFERLYKDGKTRIAAYKKK